ncbi:MAG: winged helix-turn-helix domain-containing protein [Candidatus Aenigmatarchaeota archaeon]
MPELESFLGSKGRIAILRKLCEDAQRDWSISELADAIGVDKSLVSRTVAGLEKARIVLVRKRRNLKLCQINRENGAYRILDQLFESERNLNGKRRFSWFA